MCRLSHTVTAADSKESLTPVTVVALTLLVVICFCRCCSLVCQKYGVALTALVPDAWHC